MRLLLAIVSVALLLSAIPAAFGASFSESFNVKGMGYWCKTSSSGIACVKLSGNGWGVGMHRNFVMLYNIQTGAKIVRMQP